MQPTSAPHRLRRSRTVRGIGLRPRRASAVLLAATLLVGLAACDPEATPPTGPVEVRTHLDTFTTSTQPTAQRDGVADLRVMDSLGKYKVALASFRVPGFPDGSYSGSLKIYTKHAGFKLDVRNSGPIAADSNGSSVPSLSAPIGTLARTAAATRHAIAVEGIRVTTGTAHLAITTGSTYELEILAMEGAESMGRPELAPTLRVEPANVPAPSPGPTVPPTQPPGGDAWRVTFQDEFNGTSVDRSKWYVYDQARGDKVESPKAMTCPRPDNVSVAGGKLTMRTRKANGGCRDGQAQSGAGMSTWGGFQQAGGRFETRLRWTHKGNYLWGGFWTHGNNFKGWSKSNPSEIDIFEYIGKNAEPNLNRFKPAVHYNYTCTGTCGMQSMAYQPHDVTAWHTYAIEWEPTNRADPTTMEIRFYVDDRLITVFDRQGTWRVSSTGARTLVIAGGWKNAAAPFPNPFGLDRPHTLMLSAWVGAHGVDAQTVADAYRPAGGHADLEVDFVRVYQRP